MRIERESETVVNATRERRAWRDAEKRGKREHTVSILTKLIVIARGV